MPNNAGPPKTKPQVPTVVENGRPSSKERQAFPRLQITADDLRGKDGIHADPEALARHLSLIQDNIQKATETSRFSPLDKFTIVKAVAMTAGSVGAVVATGTTPPTVGISGSPLGNYSLEIDITTGGAVGTAIFKWSSDGGTTFTSNVTTAPSVPLGSTGLTATFSSAGADTYTNDNVYKTTSTVTAVTVRHGLGAPFAHYSQLRAYSGSTPFSATDAPNNGGKDRSEYLVLIPTCTGTYDINVYSS